jgi:SAM-dependent methyltransferase
MKVFEARTMTGRELGLNFFQDEPFGCVHPRIYESREHAVFMNEAKDFAAIYPRPRVDYGSYVPRSQKFGVKDPKVNDQYMQARLGRLRQLISQNGSAERRTLLEIGASDGTFLERVRDGLPHTECSGVEPSAPHRAAAAERGLAIAPAIEEFARQKFDVICMFHVFEHFEDPVDQVARMQPLLNEGGLFVIEIPVLTDPLLSFYRLDEFKDFYFQAQHPFVYSSRSIRRLLESAGQRVLDSKPLQRYGLGNHLGWLRERQPGRAAPFEELAAALDGPYRQYFEDSGLADTLFVSFAPAPEHV